MNKKIKKSLQIILPILLGVFLIIYSYSRFSEAQLDEITFYFKKANYGFVLLSMLFGILSHLSRAYRWNFMLKPLGYTTNLWNNVMAVFIGYLMNLAVPRSGEFSRALVLNKYENVPYNQALGTIVAERVADMLVLICIVAVTFFLQIETLQAFMLDTIPVDKLIILGVVLFFVGLGALWFVFTSKSTIALKLKNILIGIKEGVMTITKMEHKWAFVFHTLFIWVMYVAMFYINIYALEATSDMSFAAVSSAFVIGSFTIAFTNGGFGSYPFFIAKILLLYQISDTVGTAFGWIVWIAQFVMMVVLGALSFILVPLCNRKK